MKIPYYVIDAFAAGPFTGNPAGVCPLAAWLPDGVLQGIAAENNLSETAFFVPKGDGYHLRWFAPGAEVDLCGHATLAAAHVVYAFLGRTASAVTFDTKSGPLTVARRDGRLVMDFPALPLAPGAPPEALSRGLGATPAKAFRSMDHVAVLESEDTVRALAPDLAVLKALDGRGVIVTAPGKTSDYVLRCFAPKVGIPEDPVTGSAQCMVAPYWAAHLGKKSLSARQLSARGGELFCEVDGNRVRIAGKARLFSKGEIHLDEN